MIQNDRPLVNPSNYLFEFFAYMCKLIFVQLLGRTVFDQLKEFVLQTSQSYKKYFSRSAGMIFKGVLRTSTMVPISDCIFLRLSTKATLASRREIVLRHGPVPSPPGTIFTARW